MIGGCNLCGAGAVGNTCPVCQVKLTAMSAGEILETEEMRIECGLQPLDDAADGSPDGHRAGPCLTPFHDQTDSPEAQRNHA